jgi:hypothetical protein
MTSPIADGVMAATQRLVQQAMSGQWQEVPKTVEHRRLLLEQLSASASPQDRQWLGALQQAMAESDAAVNAIAPANVTQSADAISAATQEQSTAASSDTATARTLATSTMEMLRMRR